MFLAIDALQVDYFPSEQALASHTSMGLVSLHWKWRRHWPEAFYKRCGYVVESRWPDENSTVPIPLHKMLKSIA